jgi:leader peptidase (prepilin peptidase) / N-methyltransferase
VPEHLTDHLIGAAAGFAFLVVIAWAYRRLRRRDGLGFGDAKLLAGIGAWVSWEGLPSVVLVAAVLALFMALMKLARGARLTSTDRIAFGTYLAAGAWLVWLYGPIAIG